MGNSAPIAARHYLQVTDADFDRAARRRKERRRIRRTSGAKCGAAAGGRNRNVSQETRKAPDNKGFLPIVANPCDTGQTYLVPPRGVEPLFSD